MSTSMRRPQSGQELLRLDRQLCFPLYAASRLVTRLYQPLLEPLGLSYPQYIVLMILWEDAPCSVSHLGKRALLNSNTLTPLLKRLENSGYVCRSRSAVDERVVELSLTKEGKALKSVCASIPSALISSLDFPLKKAVTLKSLLDELVMHLHKTQTHESQVLTEV